MSTQTTSEEKIEGEIDFPTNRPVHGEVSLEYFSVDHGTQELDRFKLESERYSVEYDRKKSIFKDCNFIRLVELQQTKRYKIEFWYIHKQPGATVLYTVEYFPMQKYTLHVEFKRGNIEE